IRLNASTSYNSLGTRLICIPRPSPLPHIGQTIWKFGWLRQICKANTAPHASETTKVPSASRLSVIDFIIALRDYARTHPPSTQRSHRWSCAKQPAISRARICIVSTRYELAGCSPDMSLLLFGLFSYLQKNPP